MNIFQFYKTEIFRRKSESLDLSNYATKPDFKNAAGADTSKIEKKIDLADMKDLQNHIGKLFSFP